MIDSNTCKDFHTTRNYSRHLQYIYYNVVNFEDGKGDVVTPRGPRTRISSCKFSTPRSCIGIFVAASGCPWSLGHATQYNVTECNILVNQVRAHDTLRSYLKYCQTIA